LLRVPPSCVPRPSTRLRAPNLALLNELESGSKSGSENELESQSEVRRLRGRGVLFGRSLRRRSV
jgi:hypothetical protein